MTEPFSLESEELAAQRTAVMGRTLALILIVPLTTVLTPWPGPLLTYACLFMFAVLGWSAWLVARSSWGKSWHQYAFVSADFILLAFTLLYPNPLVPFDYPPQFALRWGTIIYFFVLLAGLAYAYKPGLMLWGGISAVLSWTIGVYLLVNLSDTVLVTSGEEGVEAALAASAQPTYIDLGLRVQEVLVLIIVAGLLSLAVKRSRAVAQRQVKLARERENLARYFPEKTAQLLADRSDPFSKPAEHQAAVLFADLVNFTAWSARQSPVETINLLRDVHKMLSEVVFRNHGTLDKFIGDGLMATFGTPEPSEKDACNTLIALTQMVEEFEVLKRVWNFPADSEITLSVGAHYGPVIMGNIGSRERLEFAVLGDTVNIASRLEGATRDLSCRALASGTLVAASVAGNAPGTTDIVKKLSRHAPIALRGVSEKISAYYL